MLNVLYILEYLSVLWICGCLVDEVVRVYMNVDVCMTLPFNMWMLMCGGDWLWICECWCLDEIMNMWILVCKWDCMWICECWYANEIIMNMWMTLSMNMCMLVCTWECMWTCEYCYVDEIDVDEWLTMARYLDVSLCISLCLCGKTCPKWWAIVTGGVQLDCLTKRLPLSPIQRCPALDPSLGRTFRGPLL